MWNWKLFLAVLPTREEKGKQHQFQISDDASSFFLHKITIFEINTHNKFLAFKKSRLDILAGAIKP